MFFELVPHVLRDEELKPHLRDPLRVVPPPGHLGAQGAGDRRHRRRSGPLAVLTVAMTDGLALQALADPDLDLTPALELWRRLVFDCIRSGAQDVGGEGAGGAEAPPPARTPAASPDLREQLGVGGAVRCAPAPPLWPRRAAPARSAPGCRGPARGRPRPRRGRCVPSGPSSWPIERSTVSFMCRRVCGCPRKCPPGPTASMTSSASVSSSSSRSRKALAARWYRSSSSIMCSGVNSW